MKPPTSGDSDGVREMTIDMEVNMSTRASAAKRRWTMMRHSTVADVPPSACRKRPIPRTATDGAVAATTLPRVKSPRPADCNRLAWNLSAKEPDANMLSA